MEKLKSLDWTMILLVLLVSCLGLFVQYSAAGGSVKPWAVHQLLLLATSVMIMISVAVIEPQTIYRFAYWSLFCCLLMLVIVNLFGAKSMGASRWMNLGLIKIQPSEMTKITVILALARYFDRLNLQETSKLTNLALPLVVMSIPTLLVLKQPNLGTAVVIILIAVIVTYAAGVRLTYFVIAGLGGLVSVPIAWNLLYDYQKKRVLTFLNPEKDPLNSGYNILQSKIAIGSGGLSGKGFLFGTQTQLKFLPEQHTDFAFTVFAEEMGFIGVAIYFVLYAILLIKGLKIAKQANRDDFGRLVAVGITGLLFVHLTINVGMVAGLLPVVGVPLPLMSYGGSIMLTTMIGFGLLLNIGLKSKI